MPNNCKKSIEVNLSRSNIFLLHFCEKKNVWQKYCLFMQKKWLCRISTFYENKNRCRWRLKTSSKTFLNQWEPMSFCQLQTKIIWGNSHDESETLTYERDITYELFLFFLNLFTGNREEKREREKIIATIAS